MMKRAFLIIFSAVALFAQTIIPNGGVGGGGGGTITGSCATTGGVFYQSGVVNETTCSSAFTWLPGTTTGLNMAQTWNNGASTFTGIKLNVTDTASAAGSLLADWQVGGVSRFNVRKDGTVTIAAAVNANTASFVTGTASNYGFASSRGYITGTGDGVFTVWNQAQNNFDRLQFGGTTSSFPALKRSAAALQTRLADDSGLAKHDFANAQWGTVAEVTCDATSRGTVTMVQGGAGVADTFRQCEKDAADAYAWVPLNGSGSGATALAGMTDFGMVKTSSTVATINGSASSSAPVNARIGSTVYSFTGAGTVTLSGTACSATQYWYVASDGTLTMGHNASSCTYTGSGVTVATPISAYPANSIPLWTTSTTTGAWDTITGAMDKRAPNSKDRNFIQGDRITLTETASGITITADQQSTPPLATVGDGYIWLTSAPANIAGGNAIGTTLNFIQLSPEKSVTLGKLGVFTSAGASGQYACLCLYDSTGALVAQTSNEDVTSGASIRTFTFSSPPTISAGSVYYLGWAASGTATWTIFGNGSSGAEGGLLNAMNDTTSLRRFFSTGQTLTSPGASQTCPATITGSRTALTYNVPNIIGAP